MSTPVEIRLLAKPGCHLCDDARSVIQQTRDQLAPRIDTELVEVNILDDPKLLRERSEDIPVVYVGGRQHAIWRVDADRLTAAIERAAKPSLFARARKKERP